MGLLVLAAQLGTPWRVGQPVPFPMVVGGHTVLPLLQCRFVGRAGVTADPLPGGLWPGATDAGPLVHRGGLPGAVAVQRPGRLGRALARPPGALLPCPPGQAVPAPGPWWRLCPRGGAPGPAGVASVVGLLASVWLMAIAPSACGRHGRRAGRRRAVGLGFAGGGRPGRWCWRCWLDMGWWVGAEGRGPRGQRREPWRRGDVACGGR